jgi:hypothetical protein
MEVSTPQRNPERCLFHINSSYYYIYLPVLSLVDSVLGLKSVSFFRKLVDSIRVGCM